jgi:hypothetical protein
MFTHNALNALARMEDRLAETRRNIRVIERGIRDRAEAETIRRRPKSRAYHRRMRRWTGADEAEHLRIIDALADRAGTELARLGRKADRQDRAIEALRLKYRVNAPRPRFALD